MNLDQLFSSIPTFETDRLRLRAITEADWEGINEIYSDPDVGRYNCWVGTDGEADAKAKIAGFDADYANRLRARWGICLKETDELIGDCAFVVLDNRCDKAEIGYNLVKAQWQLGYTAEALRPMLEYGFDQIGMNRIEALVQHENIASRKLLEKLHFIEEATVRRGGKVNGEYRDMLLISLLKSEYLR